MAQKPVKKTVAKKAPAKKAVAKVAAKPAVKKAPAKKAAAKKVAPVKAVAKPAVEAVMAAPAAAPCAQDCGCGCNSGKKCRCGGFGRFLKKLVIFLVIFALGFATAKFCTMHKFHKGFRGPRVEFVNGCVDMAKIPCPELAQKVSLADANGDGCVSKEEFKAAKREMRKEMRGERCGNEGCSGGCSHRPEMED
ncbi:MAG: hypothetical protein LBF37_00970 [Rickettsiales bacterium]|jgi:hypothetical protein|nr:hypothetical protein [Rickettsiales bacterium]